MPGEKGLVAGWRLGLHDVPGGAARGGPAYSVSMRGVEASFGRRCEIEIRSLIRDAPWASGSPTGFFSLTMANLWRYPKGTCVPL